MNEQEIELEKLRNRLKKDPGLHTFEYVEQKFETKLESLKMTLEETIKTECKAILDKSYADATKSGTSTNPPDSKVFKDIIKNALREEEAEEYSKQKRAANIIVHGLTEQSQEEDKVWASNLIKDTHTRAIINRVTRLGRAADDKKRPLLISLNDESNKWSLLGNLTVLKGNHAYLGISVTEDLTPDERKTFKELSNKAKKKNNDERSTTEIWRVRGNSKNGFYLKKTRVSKHQ